MSVSGVREWAPCLGWSSLDRVDWRALASASNNRFSGGPKSSSSPTGFTFPVELVPFRCVLLGAYPAGAFPSARGLGSPQDDLVINLGTLTLMIDSLEIPQGSGGNLDGFRVLTAASVEDPVPVPGAMILFGSALALGAWRRRKA